MIPDRFKLLVVEDSPGDRALYRAYLKHITGLESREAEFGVTGLDLCRAWNPDCVLLDFTLPDMTGLEFIEQLRSEDGELPCALVMLTGISDERIAVRAVTAGATDYVPKSENMEGVLEHSILNAIDKHRLEKELADKRRDLTKSEHLHRSLMKALPQLVWTADAQCRLRFGNSQWWEYLGLAQNDVAALDWKAILHPDDYERWRRLWRAGTSAGSGFEMEVRLRRGRDGHHRWHLVRAVRLDKDDEPDWLVTGTDTEDQKRAEQAMAQRQKWDSIGLLAGGIAHDFNNLLVGVLGGASYVSDLLPPDHHTQAVLKNIVTSGERAAHLTRQLLAYAGKGTFVVQQVDLSGLVKQTCELIASSVPNNVQLLIQAASDLPRIETDSGQAQQVVMNLILNAVESIQQSDGGAVIVRTSLDDDAVLLEVRDNGCGMDAETQARIFDPFFTTKFTGRGLGLAAVQGILRSSGASIQVESSPGKGSIFRVRFRAVATPQPNSPGPAAAARTALFDRPATILIVDDEPTVRQICRTALERSGCTVILAEDGERGLQFLEDNEHTIDLMLLDLGMPGMDGRQVLEKVRASGITLPVIVFSGYSENEVAVGFEGLRVSSFLQKPFSASRLVTRVADVLSDVRNLDAVDLPS